jgi:xylulokinase
MPYALGLDASTQSCSAIIIDTQAGNIIADASVNFGQRLSHYKAPSGFIEGGVDGEVHSDPRMWLDALELLLEDLAKLCDLSKISAISGAGQQHGSVYLNAKWHDTVSSLSTSGALSEQLEDCFSRKTSPIWMDHSTSVACREIARTIGGDDFVCEKSGSIMIERFTGPQIRKFYSLAPKDYDATTRIHLVSSFLCSVLIGADAPIDTGDGAGMNLLNIQTWQWDPDLLDATAPKLKAKFPEVAQGNTTAGTLCDYFIQKYDFVADIPVTVFTGDNPSSLVGMGASQPGKIVISLGTSDTFFAAMPEVIADPMGCGHVFGNPLGGSMSLQCFVNGSLAREAVKDRFNYDWDQFTEALQNTPPANDGNQMLPFFRPEISPRIDLDKPKLQGSSPFITWQSFDSAIRACVEGQFLNMKLRTAWMQLKTDIVYLTGGASRNDAIAQVVADIFQAKVQRLATSSSVALGAAFRGAVNSLDVPIEELEAAFCQPEVNSTIEPKVSASTYTDSLKSFAELVQSVTT